MAFDADLLASLQLSQPQRLAQAIGRTLVDVSRQFDTTADTADDDFAQDPGPTALSFSGGVEHAFAVWGEALSLVLIPAPLGEHPEWTVARLSSARRASPELRGLLGQRCDDVRVWLFEDFVDEREPKQAGVSYRFDGGRELMYGIYLHGGGDRDVVLLDPFRLDEAGKVYSLRERRDILPELRQRSGG